MWTDYAYIVSSSSSSFVCSANTSNNKSLQQKSLREQDMTGSSEHLRQPK